MNDELQRRIQFLRQANVGAMQHSRNGLLAHLLGTRKLLEDWGARPALCDAGLFHSVYGTDAYQEAAIPFSKRSRVQELIGEEAERIAWLFCVMSRETLADNLNRQGDPRVQSRFTREWLPLTLQEFSDLANLVVANALEVILRLPPRKRAAIHRQGSFDLLFRPAALPLAQRAIDDLAGTVSPHSKNGWWEFWKS
jgi:hypothetical protein